MQCQHKIISNPPHKIAAILDAAGKYVMDAVQTSRVGAPVARKLPAPCETALGTFQMIYTRPRLNAQL